jgi:IstB-like ATP binding protein
MQILLNATSLTSRKILIDQQPAISGADRLTGGLLDRPTYHVHLPEMNGESYRLKQSKHKRSSQPGR